MIAYLVLDFRVDNKCQTQEKVFERKGLINSRYIKE